MKDIMKVSKLKIKKRKVIQKYNVEAVYVGDGLDLRMLKSELKQYQFLNYDHPLVIKFLPDKYIVLTKFGIVVFWNVAERQKKEFFKNIEPYIKSTGRYNLGDFSDKIKIIIGGEVDKVLFEKILVSSLYFSKIKMISFVFAQSVALERYEKEVEEFLEIFGKLVKNLKNDGKISISSKKLLKYIGSALEVKQFAISHLALLDKPEELWESQELENLYNELYFELELPDRLDIFNEKINFLSDGIKLMADTLEKKTAHLLEIIIILLISIEVIPYLIPYLKNIFFDIFKLLY